MLLRICRRPTGSLEGVRLDWFRSGVVYDIGPQLAGLLVTEGWAEPVSENETESPQRPPPLKVSAVILVVDDHDDLRQLTVSVLAEHGYAVVEAQHGKEGIARLCEHAPDLVLLDLNMPVMNGWEFRAEQQRLDNQQLAAIPVLLVTGEDGDADQQAADMHAAGLVSKPFDPERLLSAIQSVLHR